MLEIMQHIVDGLISKVCLFSCLRHLPIRVTIFDCAVRVPVILGLTHTVSEHTDLV